MMCMNISYYIFLFLILLNHSIAKNIPPHHIVSSNVEIVMESVQNPLQKNTTIDGENHNDATNNKTIVNPQSRRLAHLKRLFALSLPPIAAINPVLQVSPVPPPPPPIQTSTVIQRPVVMYSVAQRVEVQQIIKERSCAPGSVLSAQGCVSTQIETPMLTCPHGMKKYGAGCIHMIHSTILCPPIFELVHGHCTRVETLPVELTCQPGEHLEGRSCVSFISQPPLCPPGLILANEAECLEEIPAQYQCQPGFSLRDHGSNKGIAPPLECQQLQVTPAAAICPEGSTLDVSTSQCVSIKKLPPECPINYEFDTNIQTCVQPTPRITAPCPPGFQQNPNGCERLVIFNPPVATCPADHKLSLENAACILEIPKPLECPPGYQGSRQEGIMAPDPLQCEKHVPHQTICPPGSVSDGDMKCVIKKIEKEKQCCPPGFDLSEHDAKCIRVERLMPRPSCENCFNIHNKPIAFACPDGTKFLDDPKTPKCIQLPKNCLMPGECEPEPFQDTKNGNYSIPLWKGDILIAEPVCPEGGTVQANRCVAKEVIKPQPICDIGSYDPETNQCVKMSLVPAKIECPVGTVRENGACISYETILSTAICPPGSIETSEHVCAILAPPVQPPPTLMKAPSIMTCERGTLQPEGTCGAWESRPIGTICPPGTVETPLGICVHTAELAVPPPIVTAVPATYVCPVGAVHQGVECHLLKLTPVISICPPNTAPSQRNRDRCIRSEKPLVQAPRPVASPAIPRCPPNARLGINVCTILHEAESLHTCPDGFTLSSHGSCTQIVPATPVCPPGSTSSGSEPGCVRQIVSPPLVKIVQGCVYEKPCVDCPAVANPTCHHL